MVQRATQGDGSGHDPTRAIGRVRAHLPVLSPAMTKIAELILADPTAMLELSITDAAVRAGTSAATLTRFCHVLGYAGYVQFRVALASDIGHDDAYESWRADIGREFEPDDAPGDMLRTLLNAHASALEATAAMIDLEDVARIAKTIWRCQRLDIYGISGSAEMASELRNRLYRIGVNAHTWGEVHQGLASAAILPEDSVAIGISNSGRTTETIEMIETAKVSRAFTVAITSDRHSPLAQIADASIINATPKRYLQPDDLSAKHAQLLVLDLLYLLVAQQDYAATAARLTASRLAVSSHRAPVGASDRRRS
jgi:DNA-binding MurR/RpiR family transcriptional regulator